MGPSVSFPLPLRIAQKIPVHNSWELISKKLLILLPIFCYFLFIREVLANTGYGGVGVPKRCVSLRALLPNSLCDLEVACQNPLVATSDLRFGAPILPSSSQHLAAIQKRGKFYFYLQLELYCLQFSHFACTLLRCVDALSHCKQTASSVRAKSFKRGLELPQSQL